MPNQRAPQAVCFRDVFLLLHLVVTSLLASDPRALWFPTPGGSVLPGADPAVRGECAYEDPAASSYASWWAGWVL